MPDDDRLTSRLPCAFVIFGAAGDLARRKLLPSLFRLWAGKHLHPQTAIVGVARREWSDDAFRAEVRAWLEEFVTPDIVKSPVWDSFVHRLFFVHSDLADPSGYNELAYRLPTFSPLPEVCRNLIFYLATPPEVTEEVVGQLDAAGLSQSTGDFGGFPRLVVEKPFGTDLTSARKLQSRLLRSFHEEQIYRMDHYLGKESVQNLFIFRFGNTIYESIWNRRYVDHVQITVGESLGVGTRANYYDPTGALRDMVQNHIFQALAAVAMEPPTAFDSKRVRNETTKVIEAIHPLSARDVADSFIRGQYAAGVIDEKPVRGYREESRVPPDSRTETYVAAKLAIDTWRWSGVPFYLRTGKRLPRRVTEVAIHFKAPPLMLFRECDGVPCSDILTIRIQPDEGISLSFAAKAPGVAMRVRCVQMDFDYAEGFGTSLADAYETLLLEVVEGDTTFFARADIHEAAWTVLDPVLREWENEDIPLHPYPAGTWGPKAATELLARDGRQWHLGQGS